MLIYLLINSNVLMHHLFLNLAVFFHMGRTTSFLNPLSFNSEIAQRRECIIRISISAAPTSALIGALYDTGAHKPGANIKAGKPSNRMEKP
jgi:hypothetical protein